jgi:hypothetical protein
MVLWMMEVFYVGHLVCDLSLSRLQNLDSSHEENPNRRQPSIAINKKGS